MRGPKDNDGLPSVTRIHTQDTSRLIPSKYNIGESSVLTRLADGALLADAFDFDSATNDRLLADHELLPNIEARELVVGIPFASIINAAFTHSNPLGNRFNGTERGAWYAASDISTAQAEVAFHKSVQLAEINRFHDEMTYDEYQADFNADFHDLRKAPALKACLDPDSYTQSQILAERLLADGSLGVVYPSVRQPSGTCFACFCPALVTNVRKGLTLRFSWNGGPVPMVKKVPA